MASSEQVAAIEHWFAAYILLLYFKQADAIRPGSTREIQISTFMSDDHDVVSETFPHFQYLLVLYPFAESFISEEHGDIAHLQRR